ncbi:MAG TPA: YCF48-related protein [Bacteroidales bacterium]|nr:YCF48-related protein [Bacteroidales bacterium]
MKNYLQSVLLGTLLVFCSSSLIAQFVIKPVFFETTGVSNQGVVSGYENQSGPYSLWNPDNNTFETIGGAAPGMGVGGKAHFSQNGNFISGSSHAQIPLSTDWQRKILSNYSYIFKAIEFPSDGTGFGYAAGQTLTYNGHGIVLRTTNGGVNWSPMWVDTQNRGIEAMSFPSTFTGYVGGWNQYFAKTQNAGWDWEPLSPGGTDDVYIYTGIAFKDDMNGVVTAQLTDGPAVYYTSDGGNTWSTGSGLAAIPYKIRHVSGNTYFLATNGGHVQKSTNNGQTWTTVYHKPGAMFLGINFYDDMTGYALGETYIYKTTNGGATWTELPVAPGLTDGVLWRDINWIDENHLVIVGTPDIIFESTDGGSTWTWANQNLFNGEPALYEIAITSDAIHVCGSQGNFYYKSRISTVEVAEMSRYNVATQQWTTLGNLGFIVDNTTSAGYSISGDGSTVVGNSWANPANGNGTTPYAHAAAWNATEGFINLGSLYANINRSSRADAVSHDGSVIVGWQDFNGPWKSAVWRKNPAGGYFPNQYLLINPNGSSTDEMNQLGQASAVSADGNWIGGYGDFAFSNPWIWSESTGLVDLGSMGLQEGTIGRVTAINHDGSIVIGWYQYSPDPWTQEFTPFIWTPALGAQNLNTFITEILGYTMEMSPIYVPNAMSANGRYITGWGLDPNIGMWGELFTFRLDLQDWLLGVENNIAQINMKVYPNPVKDIVTINAEQEIEKLEVYTTSGKLILSKFVRDRHCTLDLSSIPGGVYILKSSTKNQTSTLKLVRE